MAKKKNHSGFKAIADYLDHPLAPYKLLVGATIALLSMGLVMVASASSIFSYQVNDGNSWYFAARQLVFALIGLAVMFAIPKMELSEIRRNIPLLALVTLVLLVVVLLIGSATFGQKLSIDLGFFTIQPSEFAKLAVILFVADVLERKSHLLSNRFELMKPAGFFSFIVLVLIVATGDIGTSIVIVPIILSAFYLVGVPMKVFFGIGGLGLAGIAVATIAAPFRMARFTSWFNPESDPQGTGFQLIHGMQALGSGGLVGQGLGGSREKWGTLPLAHTDFIFAVIGEELGLFGTVTVLFLFAVIAFVGIRIAKKSDDLFIELASFGIVTWLIWQMLVNVGAVLRLMPITGVPLPMVSYGGSSLIPTLAAMGLLMSFALHEARK